MIDIVPADLKLILETLTRDVEFLQEQKLMDYSLLFGIEQVTPEVLVDKQEENELDVTKVIEIPSEYKVKNQLLGASAIQH